MAPGTQRGRWRRIRPILREEGNLLEVLLDSVDVAVVACGRNGHPTHINRRAIELMGMDGSNGSDPDTWIEQVRPRTPQGRELALSELPIVRALEGEVVRDVDLLIRTSRGDVLMSTTANPVYDKRGVSLGAVAVFTDVTEQRVREARVREELQTLDLVHSVQEALAAGRLLIYAQPIIDLVVGDTILEELLLRRQPIASSRLAKRVAPTMSEMTAVSTSSTYRSAT